MVRPRDPQFEAEVLTWYYANNSTISQTAKHWKVHRQTVGRWIAEYEKTDAYSRERFNQDTSQRVRISDSYLIDFHSTDYDKLKLLSVKWNLTINETINQILFETLNMDGEKNE